MKIEDRITEITGLRIDCDATRQAVKALEASVRQAQLDLAAKQTELKDLTKALQEAVRADAKAAVALLKAEARARLLGIALDALGKV